MSPKYDVIIIGGGIMGSSVAYHLKKADDSISVAVIEKDPAYEKASTTLSMTNVRVQFSLKENILISQYAIKVFENFEKEMAIDDNRPSISFKKEGNLFMVDEKTEKNAKEALALQKSLGCRVDFLSIEQIKEKYPLYEPDGYTGGTFGYDDGHFDAYAVLMAYKAKARKMGCKYIHGKAEKIDVKHGKITGVTLDSKENITSEIVVNCAGAWAAKIGKTAGVYLPVVPVKRQVFVMDTTVKPDCPLPLTVLPSGLYFRTETGGYILLGKSMEEDVRDFDFTWDDKRFMEILWPELAEFVPAFDTAKLIRGWAGLYAVNTLDSNAILGEWPEIKGLFLANGFSGHGLQQGPAVGRYISELITGKEPALDLSIFHPERILEKRPLSEGGLV